VEDTISILRGLKARYEIHHGIRIKVSGCLPIDLLLFTVRSFAER